jgi:hypothetical protein
MIGLTRQQRDRLKRKILKETNKLLTESELDAYILAKRKSRSRTNVMKAAEADAKVKWLSSDEGKAAIARMRITDELSTILQVKSMTHIRQTDDKVKTTENDYNTMLESLNEKVTKFRG